MTKELENETIVIPKRSDLVKFTAKAGDVWKHKKRNVECKIIAIGALQVEDGRSISDMEPLIIYEHEGNYWVRPVDEFHDGRFEKVDLLND